MKKIISLFLSVVMLLSITAGFELSAYANTSGDWEYEVLDNGTVEITGYNGTKTVLTIPLVLDKHNVTSIGDYAFYDCSTITKVTIPKSVTSIGDYAFSECVSLTNVTIPLSVISIGEDAFAFCDSLTSIYIMNKNCYIIDNVH